jgi:hypothetical protein
MAQVEVRTRVPGTGGTGLPDVLVRVAAEHATVRELITRAVEEQVRLLRAEGVGGDAALDRQYRCAEEVRAQAATGAVQPPPRSGEPDAAAEAARAHRAFQQGMFVVLVGGRQLERLDEEIALRRGEQVVFLRLTPLAGG